MEQVCLSETPCEILVKQTKQLISRFNSSRVSSVVSLEGKEFCLQRVALQQSGLIFATNSYLIGRTEFGFCYSARASGNGKGSFQVYCYQFQGTNKRKDKSDLSPSVKMGIVPFSSAALESQPITCFPSPEEAGDDSLGKALLHFSPLPMS